MVKRNFTHGEEEIPTYQKGEFNTKNRINTI
jgi:hypothetical protein